MALRFYTRLVRALGELLMGDAKYALPGGGSPKADFPAGEVSSCLPLPRSTPEAEGVSSRFLADFHIALSAAEQNNLHSVMVLRHGKVISEAYFSPYRQGVWQVTHSLCKSFTGTAVGIAIHEGLFGLEDSLADHFGDSIGIFSQKKWRQVTVRHLLTMSSGITFNELTQAVETEWLKHIFSSDLAFEPGSKFVYNSINSYVLAALVCRTSGQSLTDFLHQRLFKPLGFGPVYWETSPEGIEKGGWGMYLLPEDMAKLGQLYLQNGRWEVGGEVRQIVPESWVKEATRTQIQSTVSEGYGYHFWVDESSGCFIMSGMFGQYVIGFPALDMVVLMTAGNPNLFADSHTYSVIKQYFTGLLLPGSLPLSPMAASSLRKVTDGLVFQSPAEYAPRPVRSRVQSTAHRWLFSRHAGAGIPPGISSFCGTTWRFATNRGGLLPLIAQYMNNNLSDGVHALRFETIKNNLVLFWEEGSGTICLPIGFTKPAEATVQMGAEQYLISCKGQLLQDEDGQPVLKILVCPLELTSSRVLKFSLTGGQLTLRMDETPQMSVAIESALNQGVATGKGDSGDPLFKLPFGQEYLHYRIEQICTPNLEGIPL